MHIMYKYQYQLHPQTVLRPEPEGALWFHRRSAETIELDLEGLETLLALIQGRKFPFWAFKQQSFRQLLLARGFLKRTQVLQPGAQDIETVTECLAAVRNLQTPLRARSAPEVLHISLTDACVQSCAGCFFSNRRAGKVPNQYLDFARYERIAHQAAEQKVFQLALGGGEPLMHPRLTDMITLGTQLGLVVNLTTSGSLLTPEKAQALKAAGLGQLQLSLNGATAEVHEQTRPNHAGVLNAIEHCRTAGLRFGLNVLVTRQNLNSLEDIFRLAELQGAYSVNVLRPKPSPEEPGWLEDNLPDAEDNRQLQRVLMHWQRKGRFMLQTDTSLTFLRAGSPERLASAGLGGCSAGRRMLSIQVDGRISPCSHVPMYDEVADDDFMASWRHSEHLARFRGLEETLLGACADCELKTVCRGCRAIAWQQSGDFNHEDLQCPKRRSTSSWSS